LKYHDVKEKNLEAIEGFLPDNYSATSDMLNKTINFYPLFVKIITMRSYLPVQSCLLHCLQLHKRKKQFLTGKDLIRWYWYIKNEKIGQSEDFSAQQIHEGGGIKVRRRY
jgi:hypothetical protein